MAVDRNYILNKMKGRIMTPQEFNFDALQAPPLYSLLTPTDVGDLYKLATSIRYSGNPLLRLDRIDQILKMRGFRKFTGGTNRVVYKFLEDDSFLIKVASDAVGVGDNPREWINQHHYKPFVTKVFEVSPCGTVGLFERVKPITSREEFLTIASDVFDVIRNWFTGEYVMDDIGSEYFMNWGLRNSFGPVLLDFPYAYKLDGNKLYCNIPSSNNISVKCGGVIDYDDGFNHLRCTKCGAIYKAKELEKAVDNDSVIIKGGSSKMKVSFGYGDEVKVTTNVEEIDSSPKFVSKKSKKKSVIGSLKVKAVGGSTKTNETKHNESIQTEQPKAEQKEAVGYYETNGNISNIKDLLPGCNDSIKCITVEDASNKIMMRGNNIIVITHLCGRPIEEFSILTKEAYDSMISKLEGSSETINNLTKEKLNLEEQLEEANASIEFLNEDLEASASTTEEMAEDYKNRIQELLLQIKDLKSKKKNYSRDDKGRFSPKSQKEVKDQPKETNEEIKNDIQDKELLSRIDKLIPDESISENSTENEGEIEVKESNTNIQEEVQVVEENIPVGAAPPDNNQNKTDNKGKKKSMRYDKEFYNRNNKNKG